MEIHLYFEPGLCGHYVLPDPMSISQCARHGPFEYACNAMDATNHMCSFVIFLMSTISVTITGVHHSCLAPMQK